MLYTIGTLHLYKFVANISIAAPGFVGFVGSLKKQYLKHQFGLFGWVHMSLLVLVVSRLVSPTSPTLGRY